MNKYTGEYRNIDFYGLKECFYSLENAINNIQDNNDPLHCYMLLNDIREEVRFLWEVIVYNNMENDFYDTHELAAFDIVNDYREKCIEDAIDELDKHTLLDYNSCCKFQKKGGNNY